MSLAERLRELLPAERVGVRLIDRIAFASDASVYRKVPRAVVFPESVAEVRELLRLSRELRIPLTFRAAGTSLSGQAVTDGLLVVLSRHWQGLEILDDGRRVRVQPGVIAGFVNRRLRPHGRKIGPDPASIESCMMGGVLANNSSGMCCGVIHNAYHTLDSMRYLLPDGTYVDSAAPGAGADLRRDAPRLVRGLIDLRRRIREEPGLAERIRRKYTLKNTMGYSLNAFLDHDEPLQILTHLMIGSEGTFGFIVDAVLRTIPDDPWKYTGLLFFADVPDACRAIGPLSDSGARALELMDRASLAAIAGEPGVPVSITALPAGAAALLVEYQCPTEGELSCRIEGCARLLPSLPLAAPPELTREPAGQAALWRVRKGLIPSVGAMRARGTSFIIEDVVFPVNRLAGGVRELQALFAAHGYDDAILFGHAKDGNLHFVLTQSFDVAEDVRRYDAFMKSLATLVADRYGGALKAEHGTGRNMAPFVEAEWGRGAYSIMCALKTLIDPDGLLNPGVVINDDPAAHVTDLKSLPRVESEVDACIECGFCERMCPSRALTLTPRQRIVVRREMSRLADADPHGADLRELREQYDYDALATCATDGLCALACPVRIDTGALVRRLRAEAHAPWKRTLARYAAAHYAWVEAAARGALRAGRLLGLRSGGASLPAPARRLAAPAEVPGADAVIFVSCVSRIIGAPAGETLPVSLVMQRVAARAGRQLTRTATPAGTCCGLAFASKGWTDAATIALTAAVDRLWTATDGGRLPVVIDNSPCAAHLAHPLVALDPVRRERHARIRWLDGVEYAHIELLDRLDPELLAGTAIVHPVCSVRKAGRQAQLVAILARCHERATVPISTGCCGFAGDTGFRLPELSASATRAEAMEIAELGTGAGYSSSRTCELALERSTGRVFRSFWYALDRATRDRRQGRENSLSSR